MSYKLTVYANDAHIPLTIVDAGPERYWLEYGDPYLELTELTTDSIIFVPDYVIPSFVRWVYRYDSPQGTVHYSDSSLFYHDNGRNLYIRAEGQAPSPPVEPFAWDVPKSSGSSVITAAEWTRLQSFVGNKTGHSWQHTAAVGDTLSAAMMNEMLEAVGLAQRVRKGGPVAAALLNLIVTEANKL